MALSLAGPVFPQSKPLTLQDAIQTAVQNNPNVIASRAEIRAASEMTRSVRTRRGPKISANGFATSSKYGAIFASPPGSDPALNMLVPTGTFYDANLMLMLPLFTGGRIDAEVRSAEFSELAMRHDLREVELDAALRSEDAYLRALLAAENAAAEQARTDASEELARTTRAQWEAGKGIEASFLRAEAELAESQRRLTTARAEREKALLDLRAELGLPLDTDVILTETLSDNLASEPLDTYLSRAQKTRGIVQAAQARLQAAGADVAGAKGTQRPQLYGVAMTDYGNQPMSRGSSIGLTLSFPLFDGGERRAETARVEANRARAVAMLRATELATQREVRQAHLDFTSADANVASARKSVTSTKAAYDVAALRLANGKGLLVEQLDALQTWTRARADLSQSLYDRQIALARLRRAAGLPPIEGGAK